MGGGKEKLSSSSANDLRYARRVALKVKPDRVENFLARARESVFPSLKQQAGIRRMYLLRSSGGANEFASLTLWDSKSNANSYATSGDFANNTESVREFLESDPSVTEFDVEFHDVNAKDLPPPQSAKRAVRRTIRTSPPSRKSKKSKKITRRRRPR